AGALAHRPRGRPPPDPCGAHVERPSGLSPPLRRSGHPHHQHRPLYPHPGRRSRLTYRHDPDPFLGYQIDWSAWLGDDTIVTAVWSTDDDVELSDQSATDTTATVWIAAGTAELGDRATVTCRVTTTAGRIDDRSIIVQIVQN